MSQGKTTKSARKSKEDTSNNESLQLGLEEELDEEEGGLRIGDIYVPPPPPPALTYDCTGPRLVITHIDNEYFKSYAEKETLGPFHKSFSAIVGPNGSGKSNVIDSMLFVFGYRAQKIRSKKIGVLIHNSSKFPNVDKCIVTVHFAKILDKGDDFETIPDTEFHISRTAFKDNTSYYQIGNRRVPFKEVGKLLRSHGIDLDHNRFLILQGEVEQIAMMKAKAQTEHDSGMLEYLEDIIGCHRYKKPIDVLAVQVEEFSEQRTEMLNRVKLLEKEKDDLEGPMNEALQYLKMENEITMLKNKNLQVQTYYDNKKLEKAVGVRDEAKKILDAIEGDLTKIKDSVKEKENEHKAKGSEAVQCVKKDEKMTKQFNDLERRDEALRESMKFAKAKVKKSKIELKTEEDKLIELKELPEKVAAANEELSNQLKKAEETLAMEEVKLAEVSKALQEETRILQEEKEVHQNKLIGLNANVDGTKSKLTVLQLELKNFQRKEQREKDKLQNFTSTFERTVQDIQKKEENIAQIGRHLPEVRQRLLQIQTELNQAKERENELTNKLREDKLKIQDVRSNQQANQSRGKVYETIMMLKEKKIKGIFGRLGDLGGIDEKYDIAISTACGSLDSYVTENIDVAQECVQYLKDHSIGKASFIALDKMAKWIPHTKNRIETPENVPRLYDLVKVGDERILPAFYFALQNTLVADELNQATRIGLQGRTRYRVVTLKGDMIELSGTMSGGGGRVSKGRMGQNVIVGQASHDMDSSVDCSRLERNIQENSKELDELRQHRVDLESNGIRLEKDFQIMGENRQKGVGELDLLNTQKTALEKQIREQEKIVEDAVTDQNAVDEMQKPIDKAQKEFDKANEAAEKISEEVKRVQSLINEIKNKRMGAVKKTVNALKKKVDDLQNEMNKGNAAAKANTRNVKKCEDKIESLKEDIIQFEKTIAANHEEINAVTVQANEIMAGLKAVKEGRGVFEDELKAIAKDVHDIKSRMKKLQEEQVDAKNEVDKYNETVTALKRNLKHYEEKIAKLSLHEIVSITSATPGNNQEELPKLTEDELLELQNPEVLKNLRYQIEVCEGELKDKNCNMAAIESFKRKEKQYLAKVDDLVKVTSERDTKRQFYDQLKRERLNEFMSGFNHITNKLKEVYQMLTQGGDAELELVDSLDPFSDGIVFSVRPPKKSWKNISNLSGGEKTLSSLALVMALHYFRPTPIYVMDEIDAALDFRNVSIVGHYIKERTKNAQFIVISLRNNMYELADRLVGIYKTYDCTKSITVDPKAVLQEEEEESQGDPASKTPDEPILINMES